MRINVLETIKEYDGETVIQQEDIKNPGKTIDLTVKAALTYALNAQRQDEIITAEDRSKIYGLSNKLYASNEPDFTVDDRSFIKTRAGKILPPLWYGRICDLLEEKGVVEPEVSN